MVIFESVGLGAVGGDGVDTEQSAAVVQTLSLSQVSSVNAALVSAVDQLLSIAPGVDGAGSVAAHAGDVLSLAAVSAAGTVAWAAVECGISVHSGIQASAELIADAVVTIAIEAGWSGLAVLSAHYEQGIVVAEQLIASVLQDAGISAGLLLGVSIVGTGITVTVQVADGRLVSVPFELRTLLIDPEQRVIVVPYESRIVTVH